MFTLFCGYAGSLLLHVRFSSCSKCRLSTIDVMLRLLILVASLIRAGVVGCVGFRVATHGLSSCGSWALEHWLNSCGAGA